jgi:hypothetical protein
MIRLFLNIKCQFKTLSFLIFVWVVLSLFVLIEIYSNGLNSKKITGYLIAFTITCGPSLLLYINYIYHSIFKEVTINLTNGIIYTKNKKELNKFYIHDIDSITKISSFPLAENRMQWMPTDAFFYYVIKIKTGDLIKITSLMSDDKLSIKEFKIIENKKLIAFIL